MKRALTVTAKVLRALALALLAVLILVLVLSGNDAFLTWLAPRVLPLAGFELHVGFLGHDPGRRIEIRDATFGTPGEEPWIRVDHVGIEYRLSGIAGRIVQVRKVIVEKPRVRLGLASDGTFQWPPTPGKVAPSPKSAPAPASPSIPGKPLVPLLPVLVKVDAVSLTDGAFDLADASSGRDLHVEGVSLAAHGVVSPSDLKAQLDVASVRYGKGEAGPIHVDVGLDGNVLRVAKLDVVTPEGGGVHVAGATFEPLTLAVDAAVDLDRVRLEPIVNAFAEVPELPGPVSGHVTLEGVVPDDVRIGIERISAAYLGQAIELTGRAAGSFTDYRELDVDGHATDLSFTAKGRLDVSGDGTAIQVTASEPTLEVADRMAGAIGLTGSGLALSARAHGPLSALDVEVPKVSLASASIRGMRIDGLEATGTVRGNALDAKLGFAALGAPNVPLGAGWLTAAGRFDALEFDLGVGGSIAAKGSFDTKSVAVKADATIATCRWRRSWRSRARRAWTACWERRIFTPPARSPISPSSKAREPSPGWCCAPTAPS